MALLLLDLDDTLVSRKAAFAAWVRAFTGQFPDGDRLGGWLTAEDDGGMRPREDFWAAVRDRLGLESSVAQLVADWPVAFAAHYVLDGATRAALVRARARGWRLGVVTNGGAATQTAKINAAGLSTLVSAVCISGVEGVAKPSLRLYELAAGRCGAPLAGGWMVGDNPAADIHGAAAAGMNTVWIAGEREAWPLGEPVPTLRATSASSAIEAVLRSEPVQA